MKKTLLLICAFVASLGGVMAQENLALTATPSTGNVTWGGDIANVVKANDDKWQERGIREGESSYDHAVVVLSWEEEQTFNSVEIIQVGDRYSTACKLYSSSDGESWNEIGTEYTLPSLDETLKFGTTTTKYLKIESTNENTQDMYGPSFKQICVYNTPDYGEPTVPTLDAENVAAIYSSHYSKIGNVWEVYGTAPSEYEYASGKMALKYNSVGEYFMVQSTDAAKISLDENYTYLNFAIYAFHDVTLTLSMDNEYLSKELSLTGGQWNVFRVNATAYTSAEITDLSTHTRYVKFVSSVSGETFLIDNIYFSKEDVFEVSTEDATTTVIGKVTDDNIGVINGSTASLVDLTGVTSWTATSAITSDNPNQIIAVACEISGTEAEPGTITPAISIANTKNVVGKKGGYYYAITPIEITDNNEYQPWVGSINTLEQGYTITRSVASGKYVTAYFPTTVTNITVENGDIYTLDTDESEAATVKFNKAATVGKATPFIVHATGAATITATGAGDFNINENDGDPESISFGGSCKFIGNLAVKAGTGAEYGLSSSTGEAPEFKKIGTNGKIGAFRAYFTGLSATTPARAIFDDGEGTTRIEKIENILRQDGVYYNLQGQRVLNPTKGLYIVNGKKVVMK